MEFFVSIFMGGWMIFFGLIFLVALDKEFKKYDADEAKGEKK